MNNDEKYQLEKFERKLCVITLMKKKRTFKRKGQQKEKRKV